MTASFARACRRLELNPASTARLFKYNLYTENIFADVVDTLSEDDLANRWLFTPNEDQLFSGDVPFDYIIRKGSAGALDVAMLRDRDADKQMKG